MRTQGSTGRLCFGPQYSNSGVWRHPVDLKSEFIPLLHISEVNFFLHICLTALVSIFSQFLSSWNHVCAAVLMLNVCDKVKDEVFSSCAEKILLLQLNKSCQKPLGWAAKCIAMKLEHEKVDFLQFFGSHRTATLQMWWFDRPWCTAVDQTRQQDIKVFKWDQASTSTAAKCNKHMNAAGRW